jgi:hypothetical protein
MLYGLWVVTTILSLCESYHCTITACLITVLSLHESYVLSLCYHCGVLSRYCRCARCGPKRGRFWMMYRGGCLRGLCCAADQVGDWECHHVSLMS